MLRSSWGQESAGVDELLIHELTTETPVFLPRPTLPCLRLKRAGTCGSDRGTDFVITTVNYVSMLPTRAFFATNASNIGFLRSVAEQRMAHHTGSRPASDSIEDDQHSELSLTPGFFASVETGDLRSQLPCLPCLGLGAVYCIV